MVSPEMLWMAIMSLPPRPLITVRPACVPTSVKTSLPSPSEIVTSSRLRNTAYCGSSAKDTVRYVTPPI